MLDAIYERMPLAAKIKSFFLRLEVNSAVFFSLLSKGWGMLAGAITMLLIIAKFNPELQGYYYTFSSILALQVFAELGFGTVIIQFASHEWAKLHLDEKGYIDGDATALTRLISLSRLAFKWYLAAGLILTLVLGIGGYFFFNSSSGTSIDWKLPWLSLSLLTGISFFLIPVWSLLEGCNQVSNVYKFRFIQSLFGNIAIWIAIMSGAKLWVPVISSAVISVAAIAFFIFKYRNFLKTLAPLSSEGPGIKWHSEILPMQWKIALSWGSGYFMAALFTPVLFKYYGPVTAGQMGLTLSLISIVGYISSSWVIPRVPTFGMLINNKEFGKLDKMFWKITRMVFLMSTAAAIIIFAAVYTLYAAGYPLSGRILSPLPLALLLLATVTNGMCLPMGYYLIAHKKMPILSVSIMAGILTCITTLTLGKYYSATGIAAGYALVMFIALFWTAAIMKKCKRIWHAEEGISSSKITGFKKKLQEKIKEKGVFYCLKRGSYIIFCNLAGLATYPLCRLFNVRFLPVYTRAIGHSCVEVDCYIKEELLGLRPRRRTIVLAKPKLTANPHLIRYWKRYITVIDAPLLCNLLEPLANNRFTQHYLLDYFFTMTSRFPEIQKKYGNRQPLLSLSESDYQRGWECLTSLGVPRGSWFVCVHCREDGYLGDVDQSMRNADIFNYLPAMEEIVRQGGWVIRMGDPSMKPIPSRGRIIDYAHLPVKSDWMDVFLCASCKFFLGSNSGLSCLASVFGVPSANANFAPISAILPYGPQDVGIPKLIWSIKEERFLTFKEIFDSPISIHRQDSLYAQAGVKAVENSPEDIKDLAVEMLEKIEKKFIYSAEDEYMQKRFKSLMNPGHYSYGAISSVGRDFLRKYSFLLKE